MRAYAGAVDQQCMAQLAQTFPDGNLHVVDLPYRLSSWAFDYPENIGVWEDESGQMLAWAVLQTPFWAVDYAVHPAAYDHSILAEILAWAGTQAQQIRDQPNGRPAWFVHVRGDQTAQLREIEQAGFRSIEQDPDAPWSGLYLTRSGQEPAPGSALPDGFTIRPLAGEREVAAYVDLHRTVFGSPNMTVAWRARTLRRPEYVPELDLVVEAPDGQLVAFCVCWIVAPGHGNGLASQIEPLGVHPDYQHGGLGHAVLLEGLRRLQNRGVAAMIVETDDYRDAAVALYQAAGFEVAHKILIHRKDAANREAP
jgi:ribosomal protein S18 acetylase RimI-like enzyme